MIEHRTIRVQGRVQRVRFRVSAQGEADRLGLHGYARNEPDGTVYLEVEGEPDVLEQFTRWCRKGPMFAHVDSCDVAIGEPRNLRGFEVR